MRAGRIASERATFHTCRSPAGSKANSELVHLLERRRAGFLFACPRLECTFIYFAPDFLLDGWSHRFFWTSRYFAEGFVVVLRSGGKRSVKILSGYAEGSQR